MLELFRVLRNINSILMKYKHTIISAAIAVWTIMTVSLGITALGKDLLYPMVILLGFSYLCEVIGTIDIFTDKKFTRGTILFSAGIVAAAVAALGLGI